MPALIPFLFAVLISGFGNLLLKFGVAKIGNLTLTRENIIDDLIKVFTNPFIIIGLSGYVLGFVMWLKVLSTTDVSKAYPALVSSTIIIVLIGSTLFLKESITLIKIAGIILIIFGIYLLFKN